MSSLCSGCCPGRPGGSGKKEETEKKRKRKKTAPSNVWSAKREDGFRGFRGIAVQSSVYYVSVVIRGSIVEESGTWGVGEGEREKRRQERVTHAGLISPRAGSISRSLSPTCPDVAIGGVGDPSAKTSIENGNPRGIKSRMLSRLPEATYVRVLLFLTPVLSFFRVLVIPFWRAHSFNCFRLSSCLGNRPDNPRKFYPMSTFAIIYFYMKFCIKITSFFN